MAVAFVLLVLIVDPRGDMPLNDDWNFALATWQFAETGRFEFSRLTAMSLRLQVLWGACWTLLFGKSFEVLRASTLVASLGSLLLFHRIVAQIGLPAPARVLATLALLVHPIFFWSSFTYMTQVPYLFLSVAAFYCFFRALSKLDRRWMIAGAVAVIGSYFIRQTGLANAVPPLALLLLNRDRLTAGWKSFAAIALLPVALFAVLWLGSDWLEGYPGQMDQHMAAFRPGMPALPLRMLEVAHRETVMNFQYGFLFLAPLIVVLPHRKPTALQATLYGLVLVPFLWIATSMAAAGNPVPYRIKGELFIDFGLGPPTLRDTWVFGYPYPFHLPRGLPMVLTFVSALGGAYLLMRVAGSLRTKLPGRAGLAVQLAALHALVATAILFTSGLYFDRYVLDSLWAVLVLCAASSSWSPVSLRTSAALLILVGIFSIFATQEYLRWNRARWKAFGYLKSEGIPLQRMDGGYEINQYLLGGFHGPLRLERPGFSVIDDEYILAFHPVRGYRVLRSFPFSGFLGMRKGFVHVEKREAGFKPDFDLD